MAKIQDHKHLRRDLSSGAVVNVDREAYEQHKAMRNKLKSKDNRINTLEKKMEAIESKLDQILDLFSEK
jgi:chaperonin cofactor prefoldin